jgi:hypothetical protein
MPAICVSGAWNSVSIREQIVLLKQRQVPNLVIHADREALTDLVTRTPHLCENLSVSEIHAMIEGIVRGEVKDLTFMGVPIFLTTLEKNQPPPTSVPEGV